MPSIAVEVVIDAPLAFVWADVEDISSHVDWMRDAAEIRFLSDHHRGVGTRFECDSVVGLIKFTDIVEVIAWQRAETIGVRHQGVIGGTGEFRLRASGSTTVFSWMDQFRFPWYFAGPLGAYASRPALRSMWNGNLRRLRTRIESSYATERHGHWGTQ